MQKAVKTLAAIDHAIESAQEDSRRAHLGASVIGKKCTRELFYSWRWVLTVRHPAKLLRLFDRGQREEARFVEWQRAAGISVWETDPTTNKQFRVSAVNGHFGGSLDAMAYNCPDYPGYYFLDEFKTHNNKSFTKVIEGVAIHKPEHVAQMQIYMDFYQLPFALYWPINKDNDDIEVEVIAYDAPQAKALLKKAEYIITTDIIPPRIGTTPGWHECRFCDYKNICYLKGKVETNCRTCTHSSPDLNGEWRCNFYTATIPDNVQRVGCENWVKSNLFEH